MSIGNASPQFKRSLLSFLSFPQFAIAMLIASVAGCAAGEKTSVMDRVIAVYDTRGGRLGQDYSVTVFESGRVVYLGRNRVKTIGQVEKQISRESVGRLVEAMLKIGVADFKPFDAATSESAHITIRLNDRVSRTLEMGSFANERFVLAVSEAFERVTQTADLRCPFVVSLGAGSTQELCSLHQEAVKTFLGAEAR